MDLSRPVSYRGLDLNSPTFSTDGQTLSGYIIDSVEWAPVAGIGYTEKRAQSDGLESSDVYLGQRRVTIRGTIFGETRGELFDRKAMLVAAFTPTGAFAVSPGEKGYLPLYYEEPTEEGAFPNGFRSLFINARPVAQPSFVLVRDSSGGAAGRGGSLPYVVTVECIDPRVYGDPMAYTVLADGSTSGSGNFTNRGDYPAPLNLAIDMPAARQAGQVDFTAGLSTARIIIPDSTADQLFLLDGYKKVLTVLSNDVEVLRMDLLSFLAEGSFPLIQPGTSAYSYSSTGPAMGPASRAWYYEAWA